MERRNFLALGAAAGIGIFSNVSSGGLFGRNKRKRGKRGCPYCGVMDSVTAATSLRSWGRSHFRYYMAGFDPWDMSRDEWNGEFRKAFDSWSAVTSLTFEQVANPPYEFFITIGNRRREGFGKIGGTLTWAQLPPTKDFDGVLLTKFDTAENWILPEEENGTILRTVAAHEIGHLLGLGHSNDPNALMFPFVNSSLGPQGDDIRRIQSLYGV